MPPRSPLDLLFTPQAYAEQIEKLIRHRGLGPRGDQLAHRGVTLSSLGPERKALARLLARTVAAGRYRFEPAVERQALIEGKWRTLYQSCLTDVIVLGVLARATTDLLAPALSPRVYSYLPGRSPWHAVADLAAYLDAHRRQHTDPRARGLYVLQRDVSRYGQSIPTRPESRLWRLLDDAVVQAGVPDAHPYRELIRRAVRPRVRVGDSEPTVLETGVPTGSPIQPAIANLYLSPVDRALESIPGVFYSRFGDDLLFAHPDADVAREAAGVIDRECAALELELKPEKRIDRYFTRPGRASAAWPESRPSSHLEYLGCRMAFDGTIGLKREKARRLLHNLEQRLVCSQHLLEHLPDDERAGALCAVANQALDPSCGLCEPASVLLRHLVNDRQALLQLDHQIALRVAQALAGVRGVRAFRAFRYRNLRQRWQLSSLVVQRNRRRRQRRGSARK
jgi:hypothetical protein